MKRCLSLVLLLCFAVLTACGRAQKESFTLNLEDANIGALDTEGLKLSSGDLLSLNYGGNGVVVVKAKIKPQLSDTLTIDQNYHNACDLITKNGFDVCSELQYWAVADMTDGSEGKVISFTLNRETIVEISNGALVAIQLPDVVEDLWILPSLKSE